MKVVILCGGVGTRLREETEVRPKPLVEVGGRPILWHIMKLYAGFGHKEFIIALGYKGEAIKEYFLNYRCHSSDLTVQLNTGEVSVRGNHGEDWTVHLFDTGLLTQTGGRVKRVANLIGQETFMLTYGDGIANINLDDLVAFHRQHKALATVTAVRPPARFGGFTFQGDLVSRFEEKSQIGEGWINGGFFVLEPKVLDYIAGDDTPFEHAPLERLAEEKQLQAYRHGEFWQCMDTMRDVQLLEKLWQTGEAPWKTWQ
ncbi:MAG: glucose-1-phosphate cytidylyltransferase [Acidobacteriota bacterium]